jgi:hypothetical protein
MRSRRVVEEHIDASVLAKREINEPLAAVHCTEVDRMQRRHLAARGSN